MSDFLHNLRSGKFKRNERNNRSYNDPQYRGSQRRNDNDRRKQSKYQPVAAEQLTDSVKDAFVEIKKVLENIAANQKRLAEAYESAVKAHERRADAMEIIVEFLKPRLTNGLEPATEKQRGVDFGSEEVFSVDCNRHAFDTEHLDHRQIHEQILAMREEGVSYDRIAQYLESKEVPTFSGKGKWRGQTVSKLCKQMKESI